jgi:dihydroorotate dehydrogenase (NAD+) catalytic subunit
MEKEPVLSVELAPGHPRGLRLANPVIIASGTFGLDGYGGRIPEGLDFQRLGAVVAKSVTLKPRAGNPEPRWFPQSFRRAWEAGERIFINSVGLANPGIEEVLKEKAPLWATWRVPVILSIAGETVQEFRELASMAEGTPGIAALELNLSCPNVERQFLAFGQDPELAATTVREVKAVTSLPVIAKLTPNVADVVPVAEAVAQAGADALCLSNTLQGMLIDITTRKPVLGGITGGLSGPGLKPVALAMVYRTVQRVSTPVIGCGGVFTAADALEFLMAGATAVQIGTANYVNPWIPLQVLDGIRSFMVEQGVGEIGELIGTAQVK